VSNERWLVSYADFITLLFAFFVVLYAFAKADEKKQVLVSESIQNAFSSLGLFTEASGHLTRGAVSSNGTQQSSTSMNIVMDEEILSPVRVKDDLNQIRRTLEKALPNQIAQHTVSIKMGRDGLIISLREAGFFPSGSATPRPDSIGALRQIAALIGQSPYDMRIEGHTDNVPIHNAEFDSNWELSSARATRIARIFLELHTIAPHRLSAAGYAEFHPVADNNSPEGRAENRRVDLVILPRSAISLGAAPAVGDAGAWAKITDE
jgi:chemotaxis protein MotB